MSEVCLELLWQSCDLLDLAGPLDKVRSVYTAGHERCGSQLRPILRISPEKMFHIQGLDLKYVLNQSAVCTVIQIKEI